MDKIKPTYEVSGEWLLKIKELAEKIQNPQVAYSFDHIEMAEEAIVKMMADAKTIRDEVWRMLFGEKENSLRYDSTVNKSEIVTGIPSTAKKLISLPSVSTSI